MEQTKEKIIDAHKAMSFVIKALYFAKPESKTHKNLQLLINYEDVMFRPLPSYKKPMDLKIIEDCEEESLKRI